MVQFYDRESFKLITKDQVTQDSGAFVIGQLEAFDPNIYAPLKMVSWARDIDRRSDVSLFHEVSSFAQINYAMVGGGGETGGMNIIAANATDIAKIGMQRGKTNNALYLWAGSASWTTIELQQYQQLGQNLDLAAVEGVNIKFQMDTDQMVYRGNSAIGATGLTNNAVINRYVAVDNGTSSSTNWNVKTADQILNDVNELLRRTWENSGLAFPPNKLLLPPKQFTYITSQKVSTAGNVSILKFLQDNCISTALNGSPLEIVPVKWLNGTNGGGVSTSGSKVDGSGSASPSINGTGGKYDRAVAYTQDKTLVRYPWVNISGLAPQLIGISQIVNFVGRLGQVEFVYPETVAYLDGI